MIRQDDSGAFRFNLVDDDGTVLASSKGFSSAEAASDGAVRARELTSEAEIVDQTTDGSAAVRSDASVTRPRRARGEGSP